VLRWESGVKIAGALSVEAAARHLNLRVVEAFLTVLAQQPKFPDISVAVIGEAPPEFAEALDQVAADPRRLAERMVPLARLRGAAEANA
jgi:hypothetical protein